MMDLTSMLNENSLAVEQPQEREQHVISKTPKKTRTAWDAGGYSLPINTISATSQHDFQSEDMTLGSLTSPQHLSSDSRSSLFSFTSSTDSHIHSVPNSTNESGQITNTVVNNISESPSPKMRASSYSLDSSTDELNQPTLSQMYLYRNLSPSNSVSVGINPMGTARNTFERPYGLNERSIVPIRRKEISAGESALEGRRPSSPSDAILIKRATTPSLKLIIEDPGWESQNSTSLRNELIFNNRGRKYQSPPMENRLHHLSDPRTHKRAISVPIFHPPSHQLTNETSDRAISQEELTPPSSHHPDDSSPIVAALHQAPETPPLLPAVTESQLVKCMYIPNCDTGSQLRKAISHIFGRNKVCTRQIPSHVWVHYCRKHYQRSRYRNPKEYAKLQCDLVQQQIRRVHNWSQGNVAFGRAGVVQDWSISIRKREQKRLDDLERGRKRKSVSLDEHDNENEEYSPFSHMMSVGSAVPATAVPGWLLEHCRKGYNTPEILGIFNRLHQEILDDTISTFPDIEILPNISVDQDEPWSPKKYLQRPQILQHKRAKSLSIGMSSIYASGDRRASQPHVLGVDASGIRCPAPKRCFSNVLDGQLVSRSRIPKVRQCGSAMSLHSRPEEKPNDAGYYNSSPLSKRSLLTVPIWRGPSDQQIGSQLDTSASYQSSPQQNLHQRCQSDVGSQIRNSSVPPSQGASTYSQICADEQLSFPVQNFESNFSPQSQWTIPRDIPYADMRSWHGRYNSVPMIPSYASPTPAMREYTNAHYSHSISNVNGPLQALQVSGDR